MAISAGWYFVMGIAFVLLTGLVLWLVIEIYRTKKQLVDTPLALNFVAHLSDGRFIGNEEKVSKGRNGRYVISLDPKDIDIRNEKEVKPVTVIVDNNKLISVPRGSLSRERNVNFYLPPNANDIPDALKDTLIGRAMMWATELKNYEKTVIEILREGGERKDLMLKKIGDGEISKEFISFQEGLVSDYLQKVVSPKDVKGERAGNISLSAGASPSSNMP